MFNVTIEILNWFFLEQVKLAEGLRVLRESYKREFEQHSLQSPLFNPTPGRQTQLPQVASMDNMQFQELDHILANLHQTGT